MATTVPTVVACLPPPLPPPSRRPLHPVDPTRCRPPPNGNIALTAAVVRIETKTVSPMPLDYVFWRGCWPVRYLSVYIISVRVI